MNYLIFDCAGPFAGVGLATATSYTERPFANLRDQGGQLIPFIQELLAQQQLTPSDIGSLITTRGPGSFTGIRVALATALGFHFSLHVPVFSYTLFQVGAYAAQQQGASFPLTITLPTAQNDYFIQTFTNLENASEAWQGHPEIDNTFAVEKMGLSLKSLLNTHLYGSDSWQRGAQNNSFAPLYIREPDVTLRKKP